MVYTRSPSAVFNALHEVLGGLPAVMTDMSAVLTSLSAIMGGLLVVRPDLPAHAVLVGLSAVLGGLPAVLGGLHRKKRFTSFPSPDGMSLTKLPLGRNNSVMTSLFSPRESLVVTSRLGTGNSRTFFLRCTCSPDWFICCPD
jgi:hypothetical protein